MARWEIEETRQHVCRLFGDGQLELTRPFLRSVLDRQTYAQIHYQDAKAKTDSYIQTVLQDTSLIEVAFHDHEAWIEFNVLIREIGAHLTACVQSIHAVPDILAHSIYYCLGLNLGPNKLKVRDINTRSVLRLLKQEARFTSIVELFSSLVSSETFAHLSALANQAKHRSIVFPTMSEDLTGTQEKRHTIMFPSFTYEDSLYPQVVADDFLRAEYARSSETLVHVGVELNAVLHQLAP